MTPVGYPAERAVDIVLRDGSTIHVRPVLPGDVEAIRAFLERLSPDSRDFRFFSLGVNLHAAAELAADAIAFEGLQRRHDIAATTPAAPATAGRPR